VYVTGVATTARSAGAKKTAVRRNQHYLPPVRRSRTTGAIPENPDSGALSRGSPVILPRSRDRSVLVYVTGAATTARSAGVKKPPSGGTNTTSRLLSFQLNDRRNSQQPGIRSDIAQPGGFCKREARGVYSGTRPERRAPQGPLRQSEIAP